MEVLCSLCLMVESYSNGKRNEKMEMKQTGEWSGVGAVFCYLMCIVTAYMVLGGEVKLF